MLVVFVIAFACFFQLNKCVCDFVFASHSAWDIDVGLSPEQSGFLGGALVFQTVVLNKVQVCNVEDHIVKWPCGQPGQNRRLWSWGTRGMNFVKCEVFTGISNISR